MDTTLQQSVAQRLIVGLRGDRFYDLLGAGVGGFILFTPDVADLTPDMLKQRLSMLQASRPGDTPAFWLGVDQEGGPVERLSPLQCPGLPSFAAMALLGPDFVYQSALVQAKALRDLGFNLNFTPCLDVNTQPDNPVIGVRSFGALPEAVIACGKAVVSAYAACGVQTVGKHFPGHGGGRVDSHEALPTLPLAAEHLAPFTGVNPPCLMMAHGYYPQACETPSTPASLSPRVIQDLLRGQMQYDGLVMTDDLQMGAIAGDPIEVAIQALAAGNDMLLYREAGEREWQVLQAIVKALQSGRLSIRDHQASVERIRNAKTQLEEAIEAPLTTAFPGLPSAPGDTLTDYQAWTKAVASQVLEAQTPDITPLKPGFTLLYPATTHGYPYTTVDTVDQAFQNLPVGHKVIYQPFEAMPLDALASDNVLFIASHLARCPHQSALAERLTTTGLVCSLGWIPDNLRPQVIQLPGYQSAAIDALAAWIGNLLNNGHSNN